MFHKAKSEENRHDGREKTFLNSTQTLRKNKGNEKERTYENFHKIKKPLNPMKSKKQKEEKKSQHVAVRINVINSLYLIPAPTGFPQKSQNKNTQMIQTGNSHTKIQKINQWKKKTQPHKKSKNENENNEIPLFIYQTDKK